jgi:hypothetical protein
VTNNSIRTWAVEVGSTCVKVPEPTPVFVAQGAWAWAGAAESPDRTHPARTADSHQRHRETICC